MSTFLMVLLASALSWSSVGQEEYSVHDQPSFNLVAMQARGNCLPSEVSDPAIVATIHLSESSVTDAVFLGPIEVLAISSDGHVYLYNTLKDHTDVVAHLDPGYSTLLPVSTDSFIVCSNHEHPRSIRLVGLDGETVWCQTYPDLSLRPVVDHENVLFPVWFDLDIDYGRHDGSVPLVVLSLDGKQLQVIEIEGTSILRLLPTHDGVLLHFFFYGPYLLRWTLEGYQREQWNDNWESGFDQMVFDVSGRIVGLDQAHTRLVILEDRDAQPELVDVWDMAGHQNRQPYYGWVASDGTSVAVLNPEQLLRYREGELEAWVETFSDYDLGFTAGEGLYIGPRCESYLVLLRDRLLYGTAEPHDLEFDRTLSTFLSFSGDFKTAVVGTEEGDIILLKLGEESS